MEDNLPRKLKMLRVKPTLSPEVMEVAIQKHSGHCMWADEIRSENPHLKWVSVDIQTIRYTDTRTGLRYIALTPRVVQDSLIDFDQGVDRNKFIGLSCEIRPSQVIPAGLPEKNRSKKKKTYQRRAKLGDPEQPRGIPIKIGGKPPPQMSTRREYGVRRFK